MPRGQNPNSRKALEENRKKTQFNGENAVEMQKRSVESKSVAKPFAEYLKSQLNEQLSSGKLTKEAMAMTLLAQVKNGNMKAWELMLKLIGEFPEEKIALNIDRIDSEETQAMLAELKENVKKRSCSDTN